MNERIQELYMQAIEYADSVVPAERRYNDIYYAIASGKHAELIVRECADTAYQSLYEDRVFDDTPHNIRCHVMDAIKKHFGVEE